MKSMITFIIILLLSNFYTCYSTTKKAPILNSKFAKDEKYSSLFSYDEKILKQYFLIHYFTFHSDAKV